MAEPTPRPTSTPASCDNESALRVGAQQLTSILVSMLLMGQREILKRLRLQCTPPETISREALRIKILETAKDEHPVACAGWNVIAKGKVNRLVDEKLDQLMTIMAGEPKAATFPCPPPEAPPALAPTPSATATPQVKMGV